jgi:hypothetical protein
LLAIKQQRRLDRRTEAKQRHRRVAQYYRGRFARHGGRLEGRWDGVRPDERTGPHGLVWRGSGRRAIGRGRDRTADEHHVHGGERGALRSTVVLHHSAAGGGRWQTQLLSALRGQRLAEKLAGRVQDHAPLGVCYKQPVAGAGRDLLRHRLHLLAVALDVTLELRRGRRARDQSNGAQRGRHGDDQDGQESDLEAMEQRGETAHGGGPPGRESSVVSREPW